MIAASMMSEGTESNRTLEFLAWLEVNKKRLAIGGAIVLAVVCTIATVQWLKREKERVANAALLELQAQSVSGGEPGQPSASDYQTLTREHEGTRAAARAQLLAAGVLFEEGNYEEARRAFEAAAGLVRDEAFAAEAAYGIAASLDALGQTEAAIQAYQDVTVRHATAAVAAQARLSLAALYEGRGEWTQALRLYGELTNSLDSVWSREAQDRSEALLTLHPELAPSESALPIVTTESVTGTNNASAE